MCVMYFEMLKNNAIYKLNNRYVVLHLKKYLFVHMSKMRAWFKIIVKAIGETN